jgi:hypothetical protein
VSFSNLRIGQQAHRLGNRNTNSSGFGVDPAVTAQASVLGFTQAPQVGDLVLLQHRRRNPTQIVWQTQPFRGRQRGQRRIVKANLSAKHVKQPGEGKVDDESQQQQPCRECYDAAGLGVTPLITHGIFRHGASP